MPPPPYKPLTTLTPYFSGKIYDFVWALVSVSSITIRLPRLPRIRIDTPPLKCAYYAYHRYFSGKIYDLVLILVSVLILTNRLPRIHTNTSPPSPLSTAYYGYH